MTCTSVDGQTYVPYCRCQKHRLIAIIMQGVNSNVSKEVASKLPEISVVDMTPDTEEPPQIVAYRPTL